MAIINVHNLSRHFTIHHKAPGFMGSVRSLFKRKKKTVKAVDNISFTIEEGELVGFIGPNGAGKTTTLKCLSGLLYPTSGIISVMGYTPFDRKKEFLRRISLVMGQKGQLWLDLPPTETFLLLKEIYEVPENQYRKTVDTLIDLLDLSSVLHTQVRKLSLGQRMKCELLAAFIHRPRILFLDEPTIGLDVVMQHEVRKFIKEYNKQFSTTIMLTSHYMEDVKQLCKRIIVINNGTILYDGNFSTLIQQYARNKILTMELDGDVTIEELGKIGTVKQYEYPHVTMIVPFGESNTAVTEILRRFQVRDLNIKEPDVEDIVREFFSESKV